MFSHAVGIGMYVTTVVVGFLFVGLPILRANDKRK